MITKHYKKTSSRCHNDDQILSVLSPIPEQTQWIIKTANRDLDPDDTIRFSSVQTITNDLGTTWDLSGERVKIKRGYPDQNDPCGCRSPVINHLSFVFTEL